MSGIFKGDSIYKSGGGGGGFKDGGQLVDGDFIKVENNTVSSYDNVSRDPVNFYFEVKDGEILNSVVELTTAVNATINVYILKNGFYYLLGNVGGNTVNAGDDYKVNITGDSYSVEQVSGGLTPEYVNIGGNIYGLIKSNGYYWFKDNLKGDFGFNVINVPWDGVAHTSTPRVFISNGQYFYNPNSDLVAKINQDCAPFRVPHWPDFVDSGLNVNASELTKNSSNSTGFSAVQYGGMFCYYGLEDYIARVEDKSKWYFTFDDYTYVSYTSLNSLPTNSNTYYGNIRLCCKESDI